MDAYAVHVRVYKNRFKNIPLDLDTSILSLGSVDDSDGFGISHIPIAKKGWLDTNVFIKQEPVTESELEGYCYYLKDMRK